MNEKNKKESVYKKLFNRLDGISEEINSLLFEFEDEMDEDTYECISELADDVLDVAMYKIWPKAPDMICPFVVNSCEAQNG